MDAFKLCYNELDDDIKARLNMPSSVFDILPRVAQDALISSIQTVIKSEQELVQAKIREEELSKRTKSVETALNMVTSINPFTPTLEDIGSTKSLHLIRSTKEYIEFVNLLLSRVQSGELDLNTAKTIENDWIKQVLRAKDAKAHKQRYTSHKHVKKIVREKTNKMSFKGAITTYVYIDTLYENLVTMYHYRYSDILIPFQHYVESQLTHMIEMVRRDDLIRPIYSGTISLFFSGNDRHPSYTRNVMVTEPDGSMRDGWYRDLQELINAKLDVFFDAEKYEDIDVYITITSYILSLTVYQLDTIDSWFTNDVERIIEYKDFDLFTANDKSTNCIKQCVEFLGCEYDENNTLDKMLAPKPVIRYAPKHSITHVRCLADLVSDYSNVDTTDCKNVARILLYKEHIGVICKIHIHKSNKIVQKMSIKQSEAVILDVFFDIETFQSLESGFLVPYLVCWSDEHEKVVHHVSRHDCIDVFVDKLLDKYKNKKINLLAWNGSGFDFHLILGKLKGKGGDDKCYIRNSVIIYAVVVFNEHNITIYLKDPHRFIPSSLSRAAKDFGTINKTDFPHDIIKSFDDLDVVFDNWFTLRSDLVIDHDSEHPKVKLIRANKYVDIIDTPNLKSVLEHAIDYCSIDVYCCKNIWISFKQVLMKEFRITINEDIFTLSQLNFSLARSMLPKGVRLHVPDTRDDYEFIKSAIYGGRVYAKNGIYHEPCIYLDVVSEYPAVMYLYEQPYGDYTSVKEIDWNKLGIYHVVLDGSNVDESTYTYFLPFRDKDDRLTYDIKQMWEGTYSTYDLLIAKEDGYMITCIDGLEWESKGIIFKSFIEKMFKLKQKNTGALKQVGKIGMNSVYGKLIQQPIDQDVIVVKKGCVQQMMESMSRNDDGEILLGDQLIKLPEFYPLDDDYDKMVINYSGEAAYPTQNGVFVLSAARMYLRKIIVSIRKQSSSLDVIYSDTDSLLIRMSSIDGHDLSQYIGKELGQLSNDVGEDKDVIIDSAYIAGPKMYGLEYHDKNGIPKQVIHIKGVPCSLYNVEALKHLINDKDNKVLYEMLTMKRNLVNIKMLDIIKEVKQMIKK